MEPTIRHATESDASFLAWVQQEAARSHLPRGFWDLAFPGPDGPRLALIERITRASARSFCHWSGFLVAEVAGRPVAGLCGFEKPSVAVGEALPMAIGEALGGAGWTPEQMGAMNARIVPFLTCVPDMPEDAWVVEWVATRPESRGQGMIKALLEAILAQGRSRGHELAQIGVLMGNTPAQRAYEGVGFRVVGEKRDPSFEAEFGCPGIRRLQRR